MPAHNAQLAPFLVAHAPAGPFLFDDFGWADAAFTPFFQRFAFLEYHEDFTLPTEARDAHVCRARTPALRTQRRSKRTGRTS